jgi:hypothetical protein
MSSGITSPGTEKRHIHFNEQVEQCIALEMKGDEDDEDAIAYPSDGLGDSDDSDSDDGAIMMKRSSSKRKLPPLKKPAPPTPNTDIETIAMLPSTTLKYREDTPEPPESALKHSSSWGLSISPSLSQETLRPSSSSSTNTARSFPVSIPASSALDEDDDWPPPPLPPRRDSVSLAQDRFAGLQISEEEGQGQGHGGMRRTPSGMFMPLEEDEDDIVSEGLFGRVVETVNTARDIAHVIWNVGWRR